MKLETKRLILRPARKSDWQDILDGAKDIDVTKNLAVVPHPYTKKDALWFVNHNMEKWRKKKDYLFVIELKDEKKVIGVTGIHDVDKFNGKAKTGSWINKKYWRKGYITEAKIAVLDFMFNKLKLRKIETEAFVENLASNEMSKKFGFKFEGTKRKAIKCKATGKIHDENIYGLFKDEWKEARKKLIKKMNNQLNKNDISTT